ncbi:uncharacterized protein A4U43_C03F19350, partial [Asparagus officinalis]
ELQIDFDCYDHPAVLTVEAAGKHVGHLGGAFCKNLLLKDKKHRFYVVSALSGTNIDLKVLSQRLGLGKGGLRMAPEEALQELLQVPLGCVTPFALINESARTVSLLLDQGLKAHECCLFHPLSNDSTISLSPSSLDKFLTSIGRKPSYVDLEANTKVGKENPPDLADLVQSEVSSLSSQMEKVVSIQNNVSVGKSSDLTESSIQMEKAVSAQNCAVGKKSTNHTGAASKTKATPQKSLNTSNASNDAANVAKFVREVIDKTAAVVLSEINKADDQKKESHDSSVVDAVRKQITSDLENLTVILKNTAYTQGFQAGLQSSLPRKLG